MKTTILHPANARRLGTLLTSTLVACVAACGGTDASVTDGDAAASGDDAGRITGDAAVLADGSGGDDGSSVDAGVDARPGMYGAPSSTYPAFMPFMGELLNNGGPILSAPKIVVITWPGDPSVTQLEDFTDRIGGTSYWQSAVSEYGVGAATSGTANHVHIATAPPMSMSDQDIRNFIAANVGSVLPAPTTQTIYMLYLHPSTALQIGGGTACQNGIGGYHNDTSVNGTDVAYAVVPRCGSLATATSAASHEIGEASTDPLPNGRPGWVSFTDATTVFNLWQRNNVENGDACEFFKDSFYAEQAPFAYTVQRLWSNKSGAAGHSPCQPFTDPYFNVTPLALEDITIDLSQQGGSAMTHAKGFHATLGQTITFAVGFYSDRATSGPWTVKAYESNPLVNPVTGRLTLSVDANKSSGVNGEKTYVTVKVTQVGPAKAEMLTLVSTVGAVSHYMPVLIGSE